MAAATKEIGLLVAENADLKDEVERAGRTAEEATGKSNDALTNLEMMEQHASALEAELFQIRTLFKLQKKEHKVALKPRNEEIKQNQLAKANYVKDVKAQQALKKRAEDNLKAAIQKHHADLNRLQDDINDKASVIQVLNRRIAKMSQNNDEKQAAIREKDDEIQQLVKMLEEARLSNAAMQVGVEEKEKLLEENIDGYRQAAQTFHASKQDLAFFEQMFASVFRSTTGNLKLNIEQAKQALQQCTDAIVVSKRMNGIIDVTYDKTKLPAITFA